MATIQVRARARSRWLSPLGKAGLVSTAVGVGSFALSAVPAALLADDYPEWVRMLLGMLLGLLLVAGATGLTVGVLCLGLRGLQLGFSGLERFARWLVPMGPATAERSIALARREAAGRCPFCHLAFDDPEAADLPRGALSHHACLSEARDRCPACSRHLVVPTPLPA